MKTCIKCKLVKEITEFRKTKNQCKKCINKYNKEFRKNNKKEITEYNKIYARKRRQYDAVFKLKTNSTIRIIRAFKNKKYKKENSIVNLIGCDFNYLYTYLQLKFTKGMNWDNQGNWHVDHIIPLQSSNTKQELIKLCHYTNLQPLWGVDNYNKGNKIL